MRRGPLPLSAHVARRAGGPNLNKKKAKIRRLTKEEMIFLRVFGKWVT